jgi:DNA-directed RNA polymerase specialized sigma24 family protein
MSMDDCRIECVRMAARRGASAVTADHGLVADAVDFAIHQWEELVVRERTVRDLAAWAFRVGANAAKRLGPSRRRTSGRPLEELPEAVEFEADAESTARSQACRRVLRAWLSRHGKILTRGRQLEVARKMALPGMTYHRAAKELRMDRSNLRRTFRRAIEHLARP